MGKRKISFRLTEKGISQATKELGRYKKDLLRKADLLRQRIAERIAQEASGGFAGAVVEDLLRGGGSRMAQVDVSVTERDKISAVIANGQDAIWVEFGAGVYHNGPVGTSPHPKGSELGLTIGSYGKGMGRRQTWGFYRDGELKLTHGTPAVMPMYNAVKTVCEGIEEIAREVFND